MKKLKINIVVPSTVLGGGLRIIFTYANYLTSRGHDVIVYVPKLFAWLDINNGKINYRTSIANTFKRRKKIDWFDNKFKVELALKISDKYIRDADISIATAWFTARNVYNLSKSKGKKIYFVQDYEIWHQDKNIVDNTYKLDMKKICITNTLANKIYKECGVDSEVIYNGIDDNEFLQDNKIVNKNKTIIMLGNFSDYKGGKEGLKILIEAKKKYNCRIIIFGVTKPNFIPSDIEYYVKPKRNKLISLYRESDILLFPSLKEAWGLTAIEAMANKVAVVGMKTGCLYEIGIHKKNCLLSNGSFDDLKSNLFKLINDNDLISELIQNAYETVQKFKWSESFDKFEKKMLK